MRLDIEATVGVLARDGAAFLEYVPCETSSCSTTSDAASLAVLRGEQHSGMIVIESQTP